MKKLLLFTLVLIVCVALNAQTVVFEENFDSYEAGYNLAEAGFILWEGDAAVATGDAVSGDKYAELTPNNNNFYFRKEFTLEAGKDYIFEVQTRSPEAKKHRAVARFGIETVQGEVIESASWTKSSIPFSVTAGNTEVILWIYSYPNFVLHADDFILYEATTGVANTEATIFSVNQTRSGLFHVQGAENLVGYEVLDVSGRSLVLSNELAGEYNVDITSYPNGIYILKVKGVRGMQQTRKLIKY